MAIGIFVLVESMGFLLSLVFNFRCKFSLTHEGEVVVGGGKARSTWQCYDIAIRRPIVMSRHGPTWSH